MKITNNLLNEKLFFMQNIFLLILVWNMTF